MFHVNRRFDCASLALVLSLCLGSLVAAAELDLRLLCQQKPGDNKVRAEFSLTRVSQLETLVNQYQANGELGKDCSRMSLEAMVELRDLSLDDSENVCTLKKVSKIRGFYERYLEQDGAHPKAKGEELPKWLRDFYLAYGLRVSGACKKNMITSLLYDGNKYLQQRDFEMLDNWTNEKSLIAQVMNEPSDYDDLLLPRDITRAFMNEHGHGANDQQQGGEKLLMQTMTGHVIAKLQLVCQRRFKPIYEQLILPLLELSNLGFNYQGKELKIELKEMSANKQIHQWYRIVYICESLDGMQVVEDPNFAKQLEGMDRKVVKVYSKEEASALRAKASLVDVVSLEMGNLDEFKLIEYEQEYGVAIGVDEVLDLGDKNLVKLVKNFANNKSELDRIRERLYKKIGKTILQSLLKGQFKLLGSALMPQSQSEKSMSPNEELVQALDSFISEKKASSSGDDSAVAGALSRTLGVGKRYYNHAAYHGASGISSSVAKKARDNLSPKRKFWYTICVAVFIIGVVTVIHAG